MEFPKRSDSCSTRQILGYATGECAVSLVMNGVFSFVLLGYTKALGLNPALAGFALSVTVFWEILFAPFVGHLSDHTRSRWGRRHPYMLAGGLLMAAGSYLIWAIPEGLRQNPMSIFAYLIAANLLLRTALNLFLIPYLALGFEVCTDYNGRSQLQGIRSIFNMAANFLGPAMAWSWFFIDKNGVRATTVLENYQHMGAAFGIATAILVLMVLALTRSRQNDARKIHSPPETRYGRGHFLADIKQVVLDVNARWVLVFIFAACAGMVLVSSLQLFVYDDFMRFSGVRIHGHFLGATWNLSHTSIAHGSTKFGFAAGAALSIGLVRRRDKKAAILIGGLISVVRNLMLAALFLTGWVPAQANWHAGSISIPVSLVLFVAFHASYWLGCGIMLPVATSIAADVSEINRIKTGRNRDACYASVFNLAMQTAISFSLFVSGNCLNWVGYQSGTDINIPVQGPAVVWRLSFIVFVIGAMVTALALLAIRRYPISRQQLNKIRDSAGQS